MVVFGWPWEHWAVQDAILHAVDWWYLTEEILGLDVSVTVWQVDASGEEITVRDDARAVDYDPEYARQLLAEAGLPDGFTLELLVSPDDPSLADMAHMMAAFLGDVGLHAQVMVATDDASRRVEMAIGGGTPVLWLGWW